MRVGGAYLTVRDSFISDALSECLPPSVQVLLIFVLDYLAPVPLRPPRVQPRRRPFERHIYHAARQFCSVPVGGGVLLHMENTKERPEPGGMFGNRIAFL